MSVGFVSAAALVRSVGTERCAQRSGAGRLRRALVVRSFSDDAASSTPVSDGGSGSDSGSGDSGSSDRGGDGPDDGQPQEGMDKILKFCAATGATLDKVDARVMQAFKAGSIPYYAVINYLKCVMNPITRVFLQLLPWTMSRILADDLFVFKVAVEEGLGIFGKLSAEAEQRRSRFVDEIDFVLCNLLTAFLVDFALVYMPAPSIPLTGSGAQGWFALLNKTLPSNVFETDRTYTLLQRTQGYFWTASKLFAVGFACCFASAVATNTIIYLRTKIDPNFTPQNSMQNPFSVAAMYATFLAVSSSTRYQIIAGVEQHVFPVFLGRFPKLVTEFATLGIRFGNTFWGSQQWVMFAVLTGVQKAGQ